MKQLKITKKITNRESESLDKYLVEIGKVKLISVAEEVDLAKRIREGDTAALTKLIKANLRFVVSVAKQYQYRGLGLSDLINEGNVGLIKAGLRFDETRGFKFISYAVWWIRQSIITAIVEQSRMIRLPLNRVSALNKMAETFSSMEQTLEREPSVEELAECMGTSAEFVAENINVSQRTVSTDTPVLYDDQLSVIETLADKSAASPDESLMGEALKHDINRVLLTLPTREMEVMILYYGLNDQRPLKLEEIGRKFSITRERVRQLKERATLTLRKSFRSQPLRNYLG